MRGLSCVTHLIQFPHRSTHGKQSSLRRQGPREHQSAVSGRGRSGIQSALRNGERGGEQSALRGGRHVGQQSALPAGRLIPDPAKGLAHGGTEKQRKASSLFLCFSV